MDAIYLVHRVDGGAEKERGLADRQTARVIRSDEAVACPRPACAHAECRARANGRSFSPLSGVTVSNSTATTGCSCCRRAGCGKDAYQLLIEPRDDLRFGYRLFSGPGRLSTIAFSDVRRGAETASQMMFVELRVDQQIRRSNSAISRQCRWRGRHRPTTSRKSA